MRVLLAGFLLATLCCAGNADAGMLARLFANRQGQAGSKIVVPPNVKRIADIPYGSDDRQKMDVYIPEGAHNAPVIFMVHGGAWAIGSKDVSRVVNNKVAHFAPLGIIFVSVNYRMVPDADPLQQADDVTLALAAAQAKAASWGGDSRKFILMGHSAGAHIVALISSEPQKAIAKGAQPWLGSILLDSGAYNVNEIMEGSHARFYDDAFGKDPNFWRATSPFYAITGPTSPILAICSTKRDISCKSAHEYVDKAVKLGTRAKVLETGFSHGEINEKLGKDEDYTHSIEQFMTTLDDSLRVRLTASQ